MLLLWAQVNQIKAQNDSIFFHHASPVACKVEEIGDDFVLFRKTESTVSFSVALNKVSRIKYRNGKSEYFENPERAETAVNKKAKDERVQEFDEALKADIEKAALKAAKKIKHCALGETDNFSTAIDWTLTHYDTFDRNIILIYFTVLYDKGLEGNRESFNIKLTVNNTEKTIVWKVLKASNEKAELSLQRCQEKGF